MVFEDFNNRSELNKSRTGENLDNPLSLIQGNLYEKKVKNQKGNLQFDNSFPGLIEGMAVKRKLDDINEKEKAWLKKNEGKVGVREVEAKVERMVASKEKTPKAEELVPGR